MTAHATFRAGRTLFCAVPALLALGAAALPAAAQSSQVLAIQPVLTAARLSSYSVTLYSTDEFPMRDEVVTLSIGSKSFINSSYLQGGDLHTIVFSISARDFQTLRNGDLMVVYYGQGDSSNPAAQWKFGAFHGLVTPTAAKASVMTKRLPAKSVTASAKTKGGQK